MLIRHGQALGTCFRNRIAKMDFVFNIEPVKIPTDDRL